MSTVQPITRRGFLKNMGATAAMLRIGLPPLEAMFNSQGTAYAAETMVPRCKASEMWG